MAWTAPMTFTAGAALTATQLNTHLRDNLLEQSVSKATGVSMFASVARNQVAPRVPTLFRVDAAESTSSTDYTNLTTVGPAVTVTTGTKALVTIMAEMNDPTTANTAQKCSFEVTGATDRAAQNDSELISDGKAANNQNRWCMSDLLVDLIPGDNTFTMVYRTGGQTGTFASRVIMVWPF